MPVYEYECQDCQTSLEVQQKISDEPLSICPDCQGRLRKLMSMSSFQLKGGGWYADGYASTPAGTETKPEAKPESKPETKPAAPPCQKDSGCASCPAAAAGK